MKLKSFRIQNYKSIIDSRECILSDNDNIMVLAGQNESGKSSVLEALYDYQRGTLKEGSTRSFSVPSRPPIISCTYAIGENNEYLNKIDLYDHLVEPLEEYLLNLPVEPLKEYLSNLTEITLIRDFSIEERPAILIGEEIKSDLIRLFSKRTVIDYEDTYTTPEEKSDFTRLMRERAALDYEDTYNPSEMTAFNYEDTYSPNEPVKKRGEIEEAHFDEYLKKLALEIFNNSPRIIFFDDFCNLLPDSILVSDLKDKNERVDGYKAVKNIEKVLGFDLTSLDSLDDAASRSSEDFINKSFTEAFNKKWKQKIHKDNEVEISIQYKQGGLENEGPYLIFFILTKDGEYLTLKQRSPGLRWFLSFYIELTAESKGIEDLVILIDEPGLFLHSKAQNDIKSLFEELCQKGQIIYSTHSPYLIDAGKLNRVRLVLNTKKGGTIIQKITTQKAGRQLDALNPIIDAVGLEVAHAFSPINNKNVILEGITDFHYFSAMKNLLDIKDDFNFVPSMGALNVHLLVELCIGWGLDWVVIFDDDKASKDAGRNIRNSLFDGNDNEIGKKIYRLKGCQGIEDMFSSSDFKLVVPEADFPENSKKTKKVDDYGGKEIFSRLFLEKVNAGDITKDGKDRLDASTISRFEKAFEFIKNNLQSK